MDIHEHLRTAAVKKSLSESEVAALHQQITAGVSKAQVARELGMSRQTLYQYWKGVEGSPKP
jgi:DNA-binding phage protein